MSRYTTGQIAKRLGLSRGTAWNRIRAGIIPSHQDPVSRRFYVFEADLVSYAEKNGLPLFPLTKGTDKSKEESDNQK